MVRLVASGTGTFSNPFLIYSELSKTLSISCVSFEAFVVILLFKSGASSAVYDREFVYVVLSFLIWWISWFDAVPQTRAEVQEYTSSGHFVDPVASIRAA
jgi:hypothetical protein